MALAKGVALITGASQGIGRAIALRLASDGFDVALNDIPVHEALLKTTAQEVVAHGRRAHYVLADVSSEQEVETMVSDVVRVLGGLDVMVANAGISIMKTFVETSAEDLDRILAVNLRGTFLCYKYAGKQMIAQGRGGRIIGACSTSGKQGQPSLSAYCASKFGIRALTQCAALEFGSHGITVNAYAPGPVKTSMWDYLEAGLGTPPGALEEQLSKAAALGRVGVPSDIASLVSFLASKESYLITGQAVCILAHHLLAPFD
ncbi:acetoin reductase family protein [Multifurca ochricompacta]|uniref:Acetoin reductase family protein n=1 Tax=Multifurca ochricompacta TaxID=376703 RepID=A0AAD4QND7_9AGAM|nr:acetoin reductase family protein [Multifurca ochricompacta]